MPIWPSRALAILPALVPCSRCRRLRYRRLGSTRGSARDCRGSEIRGCSLSRGRSSSSTSMRRRASFPLRYVARRASLCKVEVESILKRRIEASVQAVMAGLSSSRHLENSSSISQFPQPLRDHVDGSASRLRLRESFLAIGGNVTANCCTPTSHRVLPLLLCMVLF